MFNRVTLTAAAIAIAAATGGLALAQSTTSSSSSDISSSSVTSGTTDASATEMSNATSSSASSTSSAMDNSSAASSSTEMSDSASNDSQFITDAIEGDNSEMALGGIALGRGSTLAVRDFGYTLIIDHRKAKGGAQDIAAKLGIESPTDMKPEAVAEAQKLLGLTGQAFDQEFASYMVQDHTKDVADFKDEAKNRGTVARYAEETLPTLEKHLKIAQSLVSSSGASSASMEDTSSASSSSSQEPSASASEATSSSSAM